MEASDWGVLVTVAALSFACYFTREQATTDRVLAMGSVISACVASCDGPVALVTTTMCECHK